MPEIQNAQLEESLAIENIFGKPPGWIIHWGITSATLFLLVCLGIAAFIKYPDKLYATAVITTTNAPLQLVTPTNGKITKLFVKDKQLIEKGALIAILGENGNWQDIFWLDSILSNGNKDELINRELELGTISQAYEDYKSGLKQLLQTQALDISSQRIKSLQTEINRTELLNLNLEKQGQLFKKELFNIDKNFNRSQQLLIEEIISQLNFEQIENELLQQKRAYENLNSSILSNQIRIEQLHTEALTIQKNKQETIGSLTAIITQRKNLLRTTINVWKEQQALYAPISGKYALPFSIQEGIAITLGEALGTIVPLLQNSQSIVIATLPAEGFGKLEIGQTAIIELKNYPANQFGTLKGKVTDIAILPNENNYAVILNFSNGWTTSYNKVIPPQQQLKAKVSIKTKDYSLLKRIFQNFWDIIENNT